MTRNKVKAKFNLAMTLKEAGLPAKKIAEIVERKPSTVKEWFKFHSYKEYSEYNRNRVAQARLSPSQPPVAMESQVVVPRTYFETIDHKIDEILAILNQSLIR